MQAPGPPRVIGSQIGGGTKQHCALAPKERFAEHTSPAAKPSKTPPCAAHSAASASFQMLTGLQLPSEPISRVTHPPAMMALATTA